MAHMCLGAEGGCLAFRSHFDVFESVLGIKPQCMVAEPG